jgi:hypothetical protein
MKTNSKKIMTAMMVVMGMTAFATNGIAQTKIANVKTTEAEKIANLEVQNVNDLRFKVSFDNPSRQSTVITLTDENSNILFSQYANTDAKYNRAFDLSHLADGEYQFNVYLKKEKYSQKIVIYTESNRIALAKNKK